MRILLKHSGDEGFCVSKEDGIYADPEDETAFYMCEGEKATKKFCPSGLKFNPVISGCDIPEDVKYVGNGVDSSAKENTLWTSLPGNEGEREPSVGAHNVPQKANSKTVLNVLPPHKLLSINIFNGVHSQAASKLQQGIKNNTAASSERFQGNVQDNMINVTAMGSSLSKENFRKLEPASTVTSNFHDGLGSVQNEKLSENPSMFMAQKLESADNKYLNNAADQLEGNHRGESTFNSQESSSITTELNTKHPFRPESAIPSDNRKIQAYQDVKNTSYLQGHLPSSPRKIFKINIYGSHPQAQNTENEIHTSEGSRLIGNHNIEEVDPNGNTNLLNNGQGVVLNTPVNDYRQENRPHTYLGSNTVQEDLFTPNNSTSTPLHFKLKINMENSGKQPLINCTLSQCSENDFAIEDYNMEGKDSQSHSNGSIIEPTGGDQKIINQHGIHESQVNKEDGNFHITLTTDLSKPMSQPQEIKALRVSPNQSDLTGPMMSSPHTQVIKTSSPTLDDTSQSTAQLLHGSSTKEALEDAFFRHRNGTSIQAPSERLEGNRIKTQHSVNTMKFENVNEHGDRNNEANPPTNLQAKLSDKDINENRTTTNENAETVKVDKQENKINLITQQEHAADESAISNSSTGPMFPSSRKYENHLKKPVVSSNAYNGKELANANQVLSNESNLSIGKEQDKADEQKGNYFNNKLQTSSQLNGLANQLEDSNIKNQFHGQGQLTSQDFVQIQSRPQLKIILKTPGQIVNPLKRRSDAKGHIVKILKSLIDRPLKLGSKKKEVVSMLSNLVKKAVQKRMREKMPQDESEAIKDSGSIAESILEANKEYLDAVAMQGMVFSDGDPETENMTNILNTYQGHDYQQQQPEAPQWKNKDAEERGASTGSHKQSPDDKESQEDWLNDEHLITQIRDSGEESK